METVLALVVVVQLLMIAGLVILFQRRPKAQLERRSRPKDSGVVVVSPAKRALDEVIAARHKTLSSKFLLGAIVIEIDHIDIVRDAFNETTAHELLGAVATLIHEQLRETDHLELLSDREIVVITDELSTNADLDRLAQRIISSTDDRIDFGSRSQQVTCSLGIATAAYKDDATDLIGNALAAKNKAVELSGSNVITFDDSVRDEAVTLLELEHQLAVALENKEISVHYQPVLATSDNSIDRFECLMRWFHQTRGQVRPDVFIGIANRSDLILKLGRFVLREACYQAAAWSSEYGRPITVSVNVSHAQLLGEDFVATVNATLKSTGLQPAQLELEFSEQVVLENLEYSADVFGALAETGVRICIDNFGATTASIGVLRSLPMISTLKLDRSFVENVNKSAIEKNLVASVTNFASQLCIDVIAEGVETDKVAASLADIGVPYLQGFLFQRPAEADEISRTVLKAETALETQP